MTACPRARRLVDHAIGWILVAAAAVAATGGFTARWADRTLSVHDTRNAALAVLVLLAARWVLDRGAPLGEIPVVAGLARLADRCRDACRRNGGPLLGALIAAYVLGMGWVALRRHAVFESDAFDLAIFDQLVWRVAHGHDLTSTILERHFFGEHTSLVLVLLAPLYWLWAAPEALLVLQTAALAAGALPVFWLARERLGSANWGLLFAAAYLYYPATRGLNLFDFHPVALAVPALLFGWWALERGHWPAFWLLMALALACKEVVGPIVAVLGAFLFLARRRRVAGLALVLLGAAVFLVAVFWAIPHFREGPYVFVKRYAFLEAKVGQVPEPPGILLESTSGGLDAGDRLGYLLQTLGSLAFLPLASLPHFLLCLPTLAQNLLSGSPAQYSTANHYSALLVPFAVIAAIEGLRRRLRAPAAGAARSWLPAGPAAAPVLAACLVLAATLFGGPSPVARLRELSPPVSAENLRRAMEQIPAEASVSAQGSVAPHLSGRLEIHLFPTPRRADYVLLDAATDRWPLDPARYLFEARALMRLGYGVAWHRDTVVLLRRDPGPGDRRRLPGRFIRAVSDADAQVSRGSRRFERRDSEAKGP